VENTEGDVACIITLRICACMYVFFLYMYAVRNVTGAEGATGMEITIVSHDCRSDGCIVYTVEEEEEAGESMDFLTYEAW
jgi:hypothetical protein